MPYIKKENRLEMDAIVSLIGRHLDILGDKITSKEAIEKISDLMVKEIKINGDLNYLLYALCKRHVKPSYNNYKKYLTKLVGRNYMIHSLGDLPEVIWQFYSKSKFGEIPLGIKHNNFVGELECCVLEIYRRLISPYEDEKISENGDV